MNAILSDEAREWFITAFARLEELASIPVFDGTLDKIRIVSNVMGFGPEPMPEEEVEQHIIIHRNGQVWISRYVFGDWTSGHKKKAANRINIGDAAGKVLDSIASYFRKPYCEVFVTDVGSWNAELTNTDGEKASYHGPIVVDLLSDGVSLSELVRETLGNNDLFVFDGCPERINKITLDYTRISKADPKESICPDPADKPCIYTEKLFVDRDSGMIRHHQEMEGQYCIDREYNAKKFVRTFLDKLDEDMFYEDVLGDPEDVIINPAVTRKYELTVEYSKREPVVVRGDYDQRGLPVDWEEFIAGLSDLISYLGTGEIFEPSIYNKAKRCESDYIFLSIVFDGSQSHFYYLTDDDSIDVGDRVIVPAGFKNKKVHVTVVKKEYFQPECVPWPVDKIKHVIEKVEPLTFKPKG